MADHGYVSTDVIALVGEGEQPTNYEVQPAVQDREQVMFEAGPAVHEQPIETPELYDNVATNVIGMAGQVEQPFYYFVQPSMAGSGQFMPLDAGGPAVYEQPIETSQSYGNVPTNVIDTVGDEGLVYYGIQLAAEQGGQVLLETIASTGHEQPIETAKPQPAPTTELTVPPQASSEEPVAGTSRGGGAKKRKLTGEEKETSKKFKYMLDPNDPKYTTKEKKAIICAKNTKKNHDLRKETLMNLQQEVVQLRQENAELRAQLEAAEAINKRQA